MLWTELFLQLLATSSSQLKYLELANNDLSGLIPRSLQNLTRLVYLSLSSNNLSGGIPVPLGSHPHFNANSSRAMGSMPNLNLRVLNVDNNSLVREIPTILRNYPNLLYLNLSHNVLSDSLPPWLGEGTTLTVLDQSNNSFQGPIPMFTTITHHCNYCFFIATLLAGEYLPTSTVCLLLNWWISPTMGWVVHFQSHWRTTTSCKL